MAEPVKDWTTDYDIFSPEYKENPFPIWDELRSVEGCPIAHTDRWGGSFMPTRYEDLFNIARNIQTLLLAQRARRRLRARRRTATTRTTSRRKSRAHRRPPAAPRQSRRTRPCTRGPASCC